MRAVFLSMSLIAALGAGCAATHAAARATPSCADRKPSFSPARTASLTREARIEHKEFHGAPPPSLDAVYAPKPAVVLIEVTDSAQVRCIRLEKSSGNPEIDRAALDAPLHFTYSAAEIDGERVDAIIRYEYMFDVSISL